MKTERRVPSSPRLYGSYDAFFSGRSRVSRVQFWGLLLLGLNLTVLGIWVIVVVVSKLAKPTFNAVDGLILLPGIALCLFVVYLGLLYLRRAFAGRNDRSSHRL